MVDLLQRMELADHEIFISTRMVGLEYSFD